MTKKYNKIINKRAPLTPLQKEQAKAINTSIKILSSKYNVAKSAIIVAYGHADNGHWNGSIIVNGEQYLLSWKHGKDVSKPVVSSLGVLGAIQRLTGRSIKKFA